MQFEGGTLDQYDEVIAKIGFTPGGLGAPGGLFHWVAAPDDRLLITDVWETAEQFEAFAAEQIGPDHSGRRRPAATGAHVPPDHTYLTAG